MELTMTSGFSELSFSEMEMIDGGLFPLLVVVGVGAGLAIGALFGEDIVDAGKAIYKDLKDAYTDGYNHGYDHGKRR